MLAAVLRLIVAVAVALSVAAVPVYPGATIDTAGMKADRVRSPARTDTAYITPDSYEKVTSFYRSQKGAKESKAISIGNDASQKMAMFSIGDYSIGINWPADIYDKTGKVVARRGTRIAIGK
jgi:hypothetical protein